MDHWVIDYALHVKSMKEEEYSQEDVAGFCDAVEDCLAARGFEKVERLGLHASTKIEAISDAYLACADLSAIDGSEEFLSKLNLFRINDVNDLLPVLLAGKRSTGNSRTHQQVEVENSDHAEISGSNDGITVASAVAAVVQDLFLDEPVQSVHKPHFAPKKRAPATKAD